MPDGTPGIVAAEARGRRRLLPSLRLVLLLVGPLALIAVAGWLYLAGGRYVSTDNAYVSADLVDLTTDVSGIVKEIDVTDNQPVTAHQVLFKLDDAPFRFAVDQAKADLALARNEVETMKANWREKQQAIKLAQVSADFAERDWQRKTDLFGQHVIPQSAMDQSQQALDGARQQIRQIQEQLASLVAGLGGDPDLPADRHPRVQAAQARLDQATRELDHTVIHAPVAGIVTNVPSLQLGRYLPASTAAFGLVSSETLWIEANPKETQLTFVQPGQKVTVTVDTYPGVTWAGSVASIAPASTAQFALLPAQNTTGNWIKVSQRIPLRVALASEPGKPVLRAGMSAEIAIDTGHRRSFGDLLAVFGL